MALSFFSTSLHPISNQPSSSSKQRHLLLPSLLRSNRTEENNTDPSSFGNTSSSKGSSSARTQLNLLEQLTSSTSDGYLSDGGGSSGFLTIREQLAELFGGREGDFSIPLGQKNLKKVSAKFLTISQKRNIKRQTYLNEVSRRNDSNFFATIGAFVLLPPLFILGYAILTGYVQLFP